MDRVDSSSHSDKTPLTYLTTNSYNGTGVQVLELGSSKRDDDAIPPDSKEGTCHTTVNTRRKGTCSDGIYTINTRMVDTAGNISPFITEYIERDTTSPLQPVIEVGKNGNGGSETLSLQAYGEGGGTLLYSILKNNILVYQTKTSLSNEGVFSSNNLVGVIQCGGISYTITSKVIDPAGNESGEVISSTLTSKPCPIIIDELSGDEYTIDNDYNRSEARLRVAMNLEFYLDTVVRPCISYVRDEFDKGITNSPTDLRGFSMGGIFDLIVSDCGLDTSIISQSSTQSDYEQKVLSIYIAELQIFTRMWNRNIQNTYLRKALYTLQPILDKIEEYTKKLTSLFLESLPYVSATIFDIACTILTAGSALIPCLAGGSAILVITKAIVRSSQDQPYDFGELSLDFISNILVGWFVGAVVVPFITKGVSYIWFKTTAQTAPKLVPKVAVCAADNTVQVPADGLPSEFVPDVNPRASGINPGDTWYHSDPALRAKYPNGIKHKLSGYPDFTPYSIKTVKVSGMNGTPADFLKADKIAGIDAAYRSSNNLVWHHVEDEITMQLVSREINNPQFGGISHNGGAANIRKYINAFAKSCL